jgi:hypothetical protein
MTAPKQKFILTKDVRISGTTYYTLNLKSGKVIDVIYTEIDRPMPDGTIVKVPVITFEQKVNNMMSIIYQRIPLNANTGTLVPIKPGTVSKTRKFIINNDITLTGVASGVYPIPVIDLKRGDVIEGRVRAISPITGTQFFVQIERDVTPSSKTVYELPKNATVPYNRRNLENISAVSNNQSSSYLGESIIAKKSQQTKNILVIIAMLAVLIVAYLAVTGKLFKSLQS